MNKKILKTILVTFLLLFVFGCTETKQDQGNETVNLTLKYFNEKEELILDKIFEVKKGTNAFEAMKENIEVEYEIYPTGAFIKGIEDVSPPKGYYLALYVDGKNSEKGIFEYIINEDILIEWKTESFESFAS